MLFAVNTTLLATAAEPPSIEIAGDSIQTQLQMNNETTYRFRQRTQLTINSSVKLQLRINCDAIGIGIKYFELEIEAPPSPILEMNMTCTEEQAELGLTLGNMTQVRNRNRYRFQEGFCISLECNGTITRARLRIQVTSQNRLGTWAYYNHSTNEWVAVQTMIQDGYLVAETNHFSTWTILIPEAGIDYMPFIIVGTGIVAGVVILAAVIYYKKRA